MATPLLTRKRVIKVKVEAAKGTKLAGDTAVHVFDLEIAPAIPVEDRKGTGLYRGSEHAATLGERAGVCTFKTEMRGNGSTGIHEGLAILFQAAGLLKTSEVYNVHSTHSADKTISIDVWEDGVKKGLAGASAKCVLDGEDGKVVMCTFEFSGVWQAPIDEAMPAWVPAAGGLMKAQNGTFTIGGVSTSFISKFSLDIGGIVVPRRSVAATGGIAYFMITDYDSLFDCDPEADLIAAYDFNGLFLAETEAAVSLIVNDGVVKATIALPKVQTRDIPAADRDGIQIYDFKGQCNHDSGNDAITITATAV